MTEKAVKPLRFQPNSILKPLWFHKKRLFLKIRTKIVMSEVELARLRVKDEGPLETDNLLIFV